MTFKPSEEHLAKWPRLNHSREAVTSAGNAIRKGPGGLIADEMARGVLWNFRASHAFPLNTMQVQLRAAARRVDGTAVVAQRLKRSQSIIRKLKDAETGSMRLSQMQDVGGCRAVVSDIPAVRDVVKRLIESRHRHTLEHEYPYIEEPKATGYRSHHLVFRYGSRRFPEFNRHRIEVQVRSRLQHAWSAAVEAVDLFLGTQIKGNKAPGEWQRFFRLVGDEFAEQEGTAILEDIGRDARRAQIDELRTDLQVDGLLETFRTALHVAPQVPNTRASYFFLTMSSDGPELSLDVFSLDRGDARQATLLLDELEAAAATADEADAGERTPVLVSAASVLELKVAYPGYFADTATFLAALDAATRPGA